LRLEEAFEAERLVVDTWAVDMYERELAPLHDKDRCAKHERGKEDPIEGRREGRADWEWQGLISRLGDRCEYEGV
jgi:hypothetical protein